MRLRELLQDDDAVSPVIGVILMVAITVILAAVIASFVLGLGGNTTVAPQASFTFDYDGESELTVRHDGGNLVRYDALYFRGSGFDEDGNTWKELVDNGDATISDKKKEGVTAVSSGNTATLTINSDAYEVTLNWESPNGETTSKLADDSGPEA